MLKRRSPLLTALLMLILCASVLVGATYAQFTDNVVTTGNVIKARRLEAGLSYWAPGDNGVMGWKNAQNATIFDYPYWEPGYSDVQYIKIDNTGKLAFQYALNVVPDQALDTSKANLMDVIDVYYGVLPSGTVPGSTHSSSFSDFVNTMNLQRIGTLTELNEMSSNTWGVILPEAPQQNAQLPDGVSAYDQTVTACIVLHMQENAGNEYMGLGTGRGFDLKMTATQYAYEKDAFGHIFGNTEFLPNFGDPVSESTQISQGMLDTKNTLLQSITIRSGRVIATIPAGTKIAQSASELKLSVKAIESGANIQLSETEETISIDVHIDGIAADNTVPAEIYISKLMPTGLNIGNYTLYHVENGTENRMSLLKVGATATHNDFTYAPEDGDVTLYMATFSEVALVADTENAWNGEFDYSWYTNAVAAQDGEAVTEYEIANADQLAAFGAIVGGMDGQTQDSFSGKIVKLISDINLGDKESENKSNLIFYPIGYYNSEGTYSKTGTAITSGLRNFEGTFDGSGHTISNFYQNTWEMKGDHDWYDPTEQYYRDGMGLFGRVYGGTVKNLTVDNFSSDGEIATTGVIAAYADGATFENIAITNCNPRVYNIGNGGIVGCVGWYAKEANLKTTFKNITVDNSNKISALWGSYDVACGGLVGQYYPTSGQTSAGTPKNGGIHFENCHVSAIMDVYNDVCANYQYYAYRYAGMMIGSIRENTTNEDGKTIPNMNGISATGCTVNYGDWNDYYYCEFEKNGHPSYSGADDYKFSRVPHSELDFTDSNGNGLVDADERASVTGCKHDHTDAENNQAIYLPFHQLFTGYGWGVSSIGLEKYSGIVTNLDITEGDQEESVEKFEKADTVKDSYTTETSVTIGELFTAIENVKPDIDVDNVQVFVSPVDDDSTAGGTYVANTTDWTQGTLTFSGIGAATITITDYYFCTPTTITVEVKDREAEEKFETKFTGDFLYRVGNSNAVKLDSLFNEKDGAEIGTVSVTVEAVNGTAASGTYTPNATWTNGTIQFSGTGVVKVTITDNDYCIPTELYLEVVDAKNATTATSATSNNVVLLNNVENGSFSVSGDYAFYGNGFTIKLNPANHSAVKGNGYTGYVNMDGGTLDNVIIEGPVYPEANIYQTQALHNGTGADDPADYFRNAVIINGGDSVISNSKISGARTAICVKAGGDVVIKDTTVSGGAYANIEVLAAKSVTFHNLKTEQKTVKDSYNKNKDMVGIGIAINNNETEVYLEGKLNQYNWINQAQWEAMLGSSYVNSFPKLFTDQAYKNYWHYRTEDSETEYVNVTLVFACDWNNARLHDNRTDKTTAYKEMDVSLGGKNGGVYSVTNAGILSNDLYCAPVYKPSTQGPVAPKATFDYTTKNNTPSTSNGNDYCYYDETNSKYLVSFDDGETGSWYTDILTVTKGNTPLSYQVSIDGNTASNPIVFDTAGDYIVTYTYIDENNYCWNVDSGSIESYSVTYSKNVDITVFEVVDTSAKTTFAFGSNGYRTETANNLNYVMPDVNATVDSNTAGIGVTTVDGVDVYYPIVSMHKSGSSSWYNYFSVFEAVTINDLDGNTYNTSSKELPSGLTVIGGFILDANGKVSTAESANGTKIFNYSTGKEIKCATYSSYGLCYYPDSQFSKTGTSSRAEQTIVAKYEYMDSNGKKYYYYVGYWCEAHTKTEVCVTPDTLITLADGSRKEIQHVTYDDQLLVWDFYKGEYAAVPSAIIFDHGYGDNTVMKLTFEDGTEVKVINSHQFVDADLNDYVTITADNAAEYVGQRFAKRDGDGYKTVKLQDVEITNEYVQAFGIISALHYNILVEDMFSADYVPTDLGLFNYFKIGSDMKFDPEQMQADIDQYGLYTYEEFADYLTEEQFEAFNVKYMKVAVGKGQYTYEGILKLINEYLAEAR